MAKRKDIQRVKMEKILAGWNLFKSLIPSEEVAANRIYEALKAKGKIICPCSCCDVKRESGIRFFICKNCKKKIYFTVDTCFENAGLLHPRLAAIFFAEHKIAISPFKFFQITGVALATARKILFEISLIVVDQFNGSMASALGNEFMEIIFRRSRETPARSHPFAEQIEIEKQLAEAMGETDTEKKENFEDRSSEEQQVLSHMTDAPLSVDELSALTSIPAGQVGSIITFLELDKIIESRPGPRYVKVAKLAARQIIQINSASEEVLIKIIAFIRYNHQGVSRRYLQLYIALCWLLNDRKFWSEGSLFDLYLGKPPWREHTLRHYVSPILLAVPAV